MAAGVIFEALCVAGMVFMIRFLVALSRDGKTNSRCHVVHLTSRHPETEDDSSPLANSWRRFKVIDGGREQPFRRVG